MTLDKALEYVPALRRAALAFEETLASTTSPVSPEPVDIDDER
jgi:hypothetical protein